MSFNITVEGGTTVRLPTAGKYCDRDIIVTAEGGGVELDVVTASSLPATVTDGQIVVITDTTPGTVYIDTDEPDSPASGDLWVKLEAEATVKLELSEESPYLRGGLTGASQWDGSEWVSCDGYLGVDGEWVQIALSLPPIGTALNDFTWEQISAISARGLADDYFAIGDAKEIVLNGTVGLTTFNNYSIWAFIIGIYHNPTQEGGTFIHFQIGKSDQTDGENLCLANETTGTEATGIGYFIMNPTNTNSGGWESSHMRTVLLGNTSEPSIPPSGSLMATLPADLRDVMKGVTKYSDNVGGASDAAANMTATTDYLWLLSEWEVQGVQTYGNSAESNYQKQYDYYASGNSKVFYSSATETSVIHYMRSAHATHAGRFCVVNTAGKASASNASYSYGIAPAFCV